MADLRLKPEISVAQASAETQSLARQLGAQYPAAYPERAEFGLWIRPLQTELVDKVKRGLLVVFVAVVFVLLIACLNLANLFLARSSARSREIAVRAALTAGRLRLDPAVDHREHPD